jgi:hypothetical protein
LPVVAAAERDSEFIAHLYADGARLGARTGVNGVKTGDSDIPSDARGDLRVRYTPTESRGFIPPWKVLDGTDHFNEGGSVL